MRVRIVHNGDSGVVGSTGASACEVEVGMPGWPTFDRAPNHCADVTIREICVIVPASYTCVPIVGKILQSLDESTSGPRPSTVIDRLARCLLFFRH